VSELEAEAVAPLLHTAWLGRAWRFLPECDSTNDQAAAWARAGAPHGAVVVADAQHQGRGRQGRAWHSPAGQSLYLSVVLRPPLPVREQPPLTLAVGIAVAETVALAGVTPTLKWPNDVLCGGRKLAGILTEMASQGGRSDHVIVGIGVNLNIETFPPELAGLATSLRLLTGAPVDRASFAATLCERLEAWYQRFLSDGADAIKAAWTVFGGRLSPEDS